MCTAHKTLYGLDLGGKMCNKEIGTSVLGACMLIGGGGGGD